ncbi:MAG: VOC family protein [Acidimicrobiales bacterium]
MPPPIAPGTVTLDHVAHAAGHWRDLWDRYASDLGAEWVSGGQNRGFAPGQVRFSNGARIEMLMPWEPQLDDFLARFLERSGPGAHHLTFKVHDIRAALDEARRAGFEPVGADLSQPEWMEAFLHPKEATGVVVQLAESAPHDKGSGSWATPPPEGFPSDRRRRRGGSGPIDPAALDWVVHAVADPDLARSLFVGLLGGDVVGGGQTGGVGWTDLSWPGPLGLRLLWPHVADLADGTTTNPVDHASSEDELARSLADWLGGRPGRVHHLELRVEDPDGVQDATADSTPLSLVGSRADDPRWEVPASANQGLRLVLTDADDHNPSRLVQEST